MFWLLIKQNKHLILCFCFQIEQQDFLATSYPDNKHKSVRLAQVGAKGRWVNKAIWQDVKAEERVVTAEATYLQVCSVYQEVHDISRASIIHAFVHMHHDTNY